MEIHFLHSCFFLSDLLLHLDVPGLFQLVDGRAATRVATGGADDAVDEGDQGDHEGEDDTAQIVPHAKINDSSLIFILN